MCSSGAMWMKVARRAQEVELSCGLRRLLYASVHT
jgi:hypothetical protein